MAIVGGLDIHRRQITYDWIDTTGWRWWSRSWSAPGSVRTRPSRPTPGCCAIPSGDKTDRTDARSLRELLRAAPCPSPGRHRPTSPTPAPRSGCATR
jgi:hypothetical protein